MTVTTPPAVSEAMREAVARAIYDALPNGGFVWEPTTMVSPAYQKVWASDTWDEAPDRHDECRRVADACLSGPLASEIARLTGERDAARRAETRALGRSNDFREQARAAEAEAARLRAVIRPFARYAENCPGIDGMEGEIGEYYHGGLRVSISLASLRAALSSQEKTDG